VSIADQAALAIDRARVFDYLSNVLASIASGVVTVDPGGTIITFNRSASAIFGLPAEQAIGRDYAEVFGLLAGSRLPEMIRHVHETGEPVLGYEARADVPGRGEVVLLANIARVTGEAGERLGVVMVLEDRTHERRMQRFIAPSVVEHVLAAHASPRLGGELRTITVLFGDVQGYTTLSERLAPEGLLDLLNAHLSLAASTIMDARYRGTLDKYIGDAVMGLFNTPETQPEHAWQAVCASWAMQTRLHAFRESLPPEQHLRFRVGVNTGEAVVGHVGTEDLMNFTAVGDAVNVAKRLQESARPGQVVISAATLQALTDEQRARLQVREVGPLALKGRVAEVVAYEVLGIDEATDVTDRID
jgi:PAS domain S-box-containing protein